MLQRAAEVKRAITEKSLVHAVPMSRYAHLTSSANVCALVSMFLTEEHWYVRGATGLRDDPAGKEVNPNLPALMALINIDQA